MIINRSLTHLWQMGFGTVNSDSMTFLDLGLIPTMMFANIPQTLLPFLFLTYNSLFTCVLLSDGWNGYTYECKPLRVTNLTGSWRFINRLQLP